MTPKYQPAFSFADVFASVGCGGNPRQELATQIASLFGARHVFLFRSARHALFAILRALGGSGVAVLPAYNCIAVPEAVEWAGWRPALVDIAPGDVNMTAETLARSLPADARAVILTHQFGVPPDVEPILKLCRERDLFLIDDAAPAIGARYRGKMAGSLGDAGVISFHLTKVVNAGRGGALLTNNDTIAGKIASLQSPQPGVAGNVADFARALGWWGATRPGGYGALRRVRGWFKQDALYEIVAPDTTLPRNAFGRCSDYVARLVAPQLDALTANVAARQERARIYAAELAGVKGIGTCEVAEGSEPAWIQFPVFVEQKQACHEYLLKRGVDVNWTFRYSCGASYGAPQTPNSEKAARTVLGLPTYPGLQLGDAVRICGLLKEFLDQAEA